MQGVTISAFVENVMTQALKALPEEGKQRNIK